MRSGPQGFSFYNAGQGEWISSYQPLVVSTKWMVDPRLAIPRFRSTARAQILPIKWCRERKRAQFFKLKELHFEHPCDLTWREKPALGQNLGIANLVILVMLGWTVNFVLIQLLSYVELASALIVGLIQTSQTGGSARCTMILPLMVRVHWVDSRNEHTRPEYVHELAEDNPVLECVLVGLREFLVQDGFDPVLCPELLLRITLTKDLECGDIWNSQRTGTWWFKSN